MHGLSCLNVAAPTGWQRRLQCMSQLDQVTVASHDFEDLQMGAHACR